MELAGFQISLATRLRALKVLSGPGKKLLHEPQKLKYLLCPVIAQTPSEQERFYDLFDRYAEDLFKPISIKKTPPAPPLTHPSEESFSKALWPVFALLGLLAIATGTYLFSRPTVPPPKAFFRHDNAVKIGDSLYITNHSERMDTLSHDFVWEILDNETGKVEEREENSFHWHYFAHGKDEALGKTIRLSIQDKNKADSIHLYESTFEIHCAQAPKILSILAPVQIEEGDTPEFKAVMGNEKKYRYFWDFGQGVVKQGAVVKHAYGKQGNYTVILSVQDENAKGICRAEKTHQLTVGTQKAYLSAKPLYRDRFDIIAKFSYGTWIIMSLLLLSILYHLWKWYKRKALPPENKAVSKAERKAQFDSLDQAPYFIPFRSKNGQIRSERDLFRFADVLRQRQEGLRKFVDVPRTIQQTINGGGFPTMALATQTQPSEYLFLIDEQSPFSHQSRLFEYLAELMQEKDIFAEVYYYKRSFHRFWNDQHRDGFSLALLHRLYPNHRVFVMGNGHDLEDAFANEPALKKDLVAQFKRWKERFLLSPLPPESWTFREGLLYNLFTLFPATLEGLNESAAFLERVLDQEDVRPAFSDWRNIFLKAPHEPDVNYRKWRKANDHFKYLVEHPELYTWICAIAVCQQPTWELTIAIGKALQTKGVEVTFDNLSILARIPWLQTGDLHPRLRKDLLEQLDQETEQLARTAVKTELEAVKDLTANGHANRELHTALAVQKFSIAPEIYDHQETIRYLLDNNLLNKKQIEALHQTIDRQSGIKSKPTKGGIKEEAKDQLQHFLQERELPEEPPQKPFFTSHLKRAIQLGALYIALVIGILALDGTLTLHDLVFGQRSSKYDQAHVNLKDYFFVKETPDYNDAKMFNEMGVDAIKEMDGKRGSQTINNWLATKTTLENNATVNFTDALQFDPAYRLAQNNLVKAHYNFGVERYQSFLNDSVGIATLQQATSYFHQAIRESKNDTLTRDAWHALGLTHHYLEQKDSAQIYLDKIIEDHPRYFVELNQQPNLQTLLTGPEADRTYKGVILSKGDQRPVRFAMVKYGEISSNYSSNSKGQYSINIPANYNRESIQLSFLSSEYQLKTMEVNIIGVDTLETVFLTSRVDQADANSIEVFEQNNQFGLRTKAGNILLPARYTAIGSFSDGLAYIRDSDSKIGYVREDGQLLVKPQYDLIQAESGFDTDSNCQWKLGNLSDFSNGRALVRRRNRFGFINTKGEVVIPIDFDFATPFGYCQQQPFKVTKSGTVVNDYSQYWEGAPRINEAFIVRNGNESFYINPDGQCTRGKDCQSDTNSFVDSRDGQSYKTIKIGDQVWMAENLNAGKLSRRKIMCYDDRQSNCNQYGKLYDWESAQSACPPGWHLPTFQEVETLMLQVANSKPDLELIYQQLIKGGASGFDVLLAGGYDHEKKKYGGFRESGIFWTSTEETPNSEAFAAIFNGNSKGSELVPVSQSIGMSCRCIQGSAPAQQGPPEGPVITFNENTYDYGTIKEGEKVNYRFKFKNTGQSELSIRNIEVSCDCIQPSYPFIPIAPGEQNLISVIFDSANQSGKQRHTITVITNASPKSYKLYLEGLVEADIPVQQGPGSIPTSPDKLTGRQLKDFIASLREIRNKNQSLLKTLSSIESNNEETVSKVASTTITLTSLDSKIILNENLDKAKELSLKESQDILNRLIQDQNNIERTIKELNY